MTPEGKTKARIKRVLEKYNCWYYMPVPGGYGEPTLDFHCARHDDCEFFMIEAKAHKQDPSPRQELSIKAAHEKNITVFVIDDEADHLTPKHQSCAELDAWLAEPRI